MYGTYIRQHVWYEVLSYAGIYHTRMLQKYAYSIEHLHSDHKAHHTHNTIHNH